MGENKRHYIGARFTEKEKKVISSFASERNQTISELLREAVFSHINFLKQFKSKTKKVEVYIING